MMAGARMRIEADLLQGQAVGSEIRMFGRVLGVPIWVVEKVTDYNPPLRKVWETTLEPRLLVLGATAWECSSLNWRKPFISSDTSTSLAVARWGYQAASTARGQAWVQAGQFELVGPEYLEVFS